MPGEKINPFRSENDSAASFAGLIQSRLKRGGIVRFAVRFRSKVTNRVNVRVRALDGDSERETNEKQRCCVFHDERYTGGRADSITRRPRQRKLADVFLSRLRINFPFHRRHARSVTRRFERKYKLLDKRM